MGNSSGLRFCMVTTFYPPYHFGGDAVFIRRLAHALVRHGHTVDVIHDVDAFAVLHRGAWPDPLPEPDGLRVHRLRSRFGFLSCLATQQLGRPVVHGRQIRQILGEGRFDVLHFHNISLVGGPAVLDYGTGIKLYTAHEHWLVCPMHVLWRHNRELCTGRQCIRCTVRFRRPPQLWRYSHLLGRKIRRIDAFISPSQFSADKHREFGFPRPLEVIPYFLPDLDSGQEVEAPPATSQSRPYFLFVGRLEKIKGVQDIIQHFDDQAPADLLIAGTGEYEPHLRELASAFPRVRFLGRLSPEELRYFYRHAIAVVVPSLCYETFGIILLEAFRDRTPVIARALGPFTEIVQQSGGGLLFRTADELKEALWKLASDKSFRDLLGERGHQKVQELWTERVVIQQYFHLIRRIAQDRVLPHIVNSLNGAVLTSPTV